MQNIKPFLLLISLCCLSGLVKGQYAVDLPAAESLCTNSDYLLYIQPTDNNPQNHTIEWQVNTGSGFVSLLSGTGTNSYLLEDLDNSFDGNAYRAILDGTDTSTVLTITISPNVPNINNFIDNKPLEVCVGENITIGATLFGGAGPSGPFTWYIGTDMNSLRVFSTEGINGSNTPASVTVNSVTSDSLIVIQFRKGSGNPACFSRIDSSIISANAPPNPSGGTYSDVCENDPPLLLGGSNPSGGSWSGPGVSQASNDYLFTPTNALVGTNSLFYTVNQGGCTVVDTVSITVLAIPTVQAPSSLIVSRSTCINGSSITLADGSPGLGVWTDSTDTNLTSFDPTVYGLGPHVLTYTFTDVSGCSGNDTIHIRVNDLPVVDAGNNQTICINAAPINLGAFPSGGAWSGSGMSGNTFTASNAGLGLHTLTYTYTDANGCTNFDTKDITVVSIPPDPSLLAMDSCLNEDVSIQVTGSAGVTVCVYTSPTPGSPLQCKNLDGSGNETFLFSPTSPGTLTYYFREEIPGGCNSNLVPITVEVVSPPDPPLIADNPACEGVSTNLTVSSSVSGAAYAWFDDAQLSNQVSGGNNYTTPPLTLGTTIYATVFDPATGCTSDGASLDVTVYANPSPVISPTNMEECDQTAHELSASSSTSGTGTITSVFWDFGDLSTDTMTANLVDLVSHTYSGPDTFSVSLTITDDLGCVGQTETELVVLPLPKRIPVSDLDSTLCVNAGATPLPTPINGYSYDWQGDCVSGDNEFDPSCEPSSITSSVPKNLTVQITDDKGCTDLFQHTFFINPVPIADFALDNVCLKSAFSPTDLSANQPDDWFWFVDGNEDTINGQEPIFEFEDPGDVGLHTFQLVVNSDGCKDSADKVIEVFDVPRPAYPLPDAPCPGVEIEFNASNSQGNYGGTLTYSWDFGDGMGVESGVMPTYAFPLSDTTLSVALTLSEEVESGLQCEAVLSKSLQILPQPFALLNSSLPTEMDCYTHPVSFSDLSTGQGGGSIVERFWDPGDGNSEMPLTSSNFSYTYGLPEPVSGEETYMSVLRVVDTNGCTNLYTLPITVDYSGPLVSDEPLKLGKDLLVSRDDGPDISYQWFKVCNGDTSEASGDNTRQFYCVKPEDRQCDFMVVTQKAGNECETRSALGRVEGREGLPLEVLFARGMTIFPSPNNGNFTLELLHEIEGLGQVRIVDLAGRQIYQSLIQKEGTLFSAKIQTNGIAEGMYLLEVQFGNGVWFSQKMMVR